MAVRNDNLPGGNDWGTEKLLSDDLNDTFDVIVNNLKAVTAFWLNSDVYDVFEDFESYSLGNTWVDNTKWNINAATAQIVNSTEGGSGYAGEVTQTNWAKTKTLTADKHKHAIIYASWSGNSMPGGNYTRFSFGGTTYQINAATTSGFSRCDLFIVAKGSNVYDVYYSGKKVGSDVTEADPQIGIYGYNYSSGGSNSIGKVMIDDIRESKTAVV